MLDPHLNLVSVFGPNEELLYLNSLKCISLLDSSRILLSEPLNPEPHEFFFKLCPNAFKL